MAFPAHLFACFTTQDSRWHPYGAYSPDVPGCVAVADTREEVEQLMKEALQEHPQMMPEENLPLPPSLSEAEYLDISLSA